jgi:hypothetical protein
MAKEALLTVNHVFADIAVADYDSALAWYTLFFGRPPDVVVTENESMWQVAEAGWIYVVGDANRAGKVLLTLLVDHLEGHVASARALLPRDTSHFFHDYFEGPPYIIFTVKWDIRRRAHARNRPPAWI